MVSSHDEAVDIIWQDWDNFEYTRTMDTKELVHWLFAITYHGYAVPKPWKKYDDAEPYRLQLRAAWNTWEQYPVIWAAVSWRVIETTEREGRRLLDMKSHLMLRNFGKNLGLTSLLSVLVDTTTIRLYTNGNGLVIWYKSNKYSAQRTNMGQSEIPHLWVKFSWNTVSLPNTWESDTYTFKSEEEVPIEPKELVQSIVKHVYATKEKTYEYWI